MPSQYTKPSLSCIDQLSLLKQSGLIIDDDKKALHLLEHIGSYRLSGYWYILLDTPKAEHRFKPQSTFNAAFRMYCFDRELRQLVLGEIEKIEVAVKSQISHVYSAEFGAQWYANPALFNNKKNRHTDTIKVITYKSDAFVAIHDTMSGMYDAGVIDKKTMREFDEACLTPVHAFSATDIKALREREEVSQRVFALYMNVSKDSVTQWERGIKKPAGPTLKLLSLVKQKVLSAIT